jgi:hypothetical protein
MRSLMASFSALFWSLRVSKVDKTEGGGFKDYYTAGGFFLKDLPTVNQFCSILIIED